MNDSTTNPQVLPLPQSRDVLTALLREGAQRMLTQAIEAEVADWIGAHANHGDRLQIADGFAHSFISRRSALIPGLLPGPEGP